MRKYCSIFQSHLLFSLQHIHHRLIHLTPADYDDFVNMIRSARSAFCLTPVGMMQFNDVLQNLKRGKQTKELWQRISLEMATFSPWAAHSGGREDVLGLSLGLKTHPTSKYSYCHCTWPVTRVIFVRDAALCSEDSVKDTQAVQSTPIPHLQTCFCVHPPRVLWRRRITFLLRSDVSSSFLCVNVEFPCIPSFLHFSSTSDWQRSVSSSSLCSLFVFEFLRKPLREFSLCCNIPVWVVDASFTRVLSLWIWIIGVGDETIFEKKDLIWSILLSPLVRIFQYFV